jgi:hypothetical protein
LIVSLHPSACMEYALQPKPDTNQIGKSSEKDQNWASENKSQISTTII